MATIKNDELNALQQQKHINERQHDTKIITDEEYDTRRISLEDKINEKIHNILVKNDERIREENAIEVEKKMSEEKVEKKEKVEKVEKVEKTEPVGKPISYTKLIIKVLSLKKFKDLDSVIDRVLELRPGRDRKKVKGQVKSIIFLVKKKDPKNAKRWLDFIWSQDEFLLTIKEK